MEQINYFIYCRRSSESEDKQIQSLDNQIEVLTKKAKRENLNVIDIFQESKSAKKPDNRPVFQEMIRRIKNHEANGIICWNLNRLFRNPSDQGNIHWLLQDSTIRSIKTFDKEYKSDDGALLFSVEGGMATDYIINLRKDVKRGMSRKLENGQAPYLVPIGYINNKIEKTVEIDPERFPLVRKMWDLMLSGTYTPAQIARIANEQGHFKTRQFKRIGGKPISNSVVYKMFRNKFYIGKIIFSNEEYKGEYLPMVTTSEFNRVQQILGLNNSPKPQKHEFAFTGSIRCGECGCLFTAEIKKKKLKSGEINYHTYYHCTNKKRDINCSQRRVIPVRELEKQISEELAKYEILPEFKDWALEVLASNYEREVETRSKIYKSISDQIIEKQKQIDNLIKMLCRELITEDEYTKEKAKLNEELSNLKSQEGQTEERAKNWNEIAEKIFYFAAHAKEEFENGSLQRKKEILVTLGSNAKIINGKFTIEAKKWFTPIKEKYPSIEIEYLRLEPNKMKLESNKIGENLSITGIKNEWLPR